MIIDGEEFYISEDDGSQKILKNGKWQKSSETLLDRPVGETINIFGKEVFVQESGLHKLSSMKGFVNSDLIPGKEYEYLDGIIDGKIYYFEKEIGADKVRVNKEI
ncbi:MAG: hypothetical protein Q9M97_01170 [Candidatus Gracilibacteria bacterium]|nr:hypothetical protein [Candidatus Gracilibacteria bacterium]